MAAVAVGCGRPREAKRESEERRSPAASEDGTAALESRVMPGMPLQVVCYERAEDIAFGVSGAVTRGRGIRRTFPDLDVSEIPMAQPVGDEKVLYLLDPIGASRRTDAVRAIDRVLRGLPSARREHAVQLPWIPPFLRKRDGFLFSLGQFNQWVGSRLTMHGLAQIWPGMPVSSALVEDDRVVGVRLVDQGTTRSGEPDAGFMPGMDVRAALTVVADGPVGPVGAQLDEQFGVPENHDCDDWAIRAFCRFYPELPVVLDAVGVFWCFYIFHQRNVAMDCHQLI